MEAPKTEMSLEEYLEGSKTWEIRHEWVRGQAWAMTGGRPRQGAVIANVTRAIGNARAGLPCRETSSAQHIDPEQPHVVHHARTDEGWLRRDLRDGAVHLTGIDALELPFSAIYANLDDVQAADA